VAETNTVTINSFFLELGSVPLGAVGIDAGTLTVFQDISCVGGSLKRWMGLDVLVVITAHCELLSSTDPRDGLRPNVHPAWMVAGLFV